MEKLIKKMQKDIEDLDKKIDKNQMDCNAEMQTLMTEDLVSEMGETANDPTLRDETKTLGEQLADPGEDSKFFQAYMKNKFETVRGTFRKVVNQV